MRRTSRRIPGCRPSVHSHSTPRRSHAHWQTTAPHWLSGRRTAAITGHGSLPGSHPQLQGRLWRKSATAPETPLRPVLGNCERRMNSAMSVWYMACSRPPLPYRSPKQAPEATREPVSFMGHWQLQGCRMAEWPMGHRDHRSTRTLQASPSHERSRGPPRRACRRGQRMALGTSQSRMASCPLEFEQEVATGRCLNG